MRHAMTRCGSPQGISRCGAYNGPIVGFAEVLFSFESMYPMSQASCWRERAARKSRKVCPPAIVATKTGRARAAKDALEGADVVITMLPGSSDVLSATYNPWLWRLPHGARAWRAQRPPKSKASTRGAISFACKASACRMPPWRDTAQGEGVIDRRAPHGWDESSRNLGGPSLQHRVTHTEPLANWFRGAHVNKIALMP